MFPCPFPGSHEMLQETNLRIDSEEVAQTLFFQHSAHTPMPPPIIPLHSNKYIRPPLAHK